jgi:organic radical activating enzyme
MDTKLLDTGLYLPIVEEFYTLQGEGLQVGRAAYFVRVGGCDVACAWCDTKESWNPALFPPKPVDELVARTASYPAKAVVITGGEPLSWNLGYLCDELKKHDITTFLETSGSQELSGTWDWICLSPKKNAPPLDEIFDHAHELKVVIHDDSDFAWAEENAQKVPESTALLMQPEWSRRELMIPKIIDYILKNPRWRISVQTHKWLRIP